MTRIPTLSLEPLVTGKKFFDLHRIIGQRFGGGVDRGQSAADNDDRQSHRQIGDAVSLCRPVS